MIQEPNIIMNVERYGNIIGAYFINIIYGLEHAL